jgi:hypothetical protein
MMDIIKMFMKYDDVRETLEMVIITVVTIGLAPMTIYLANLSF